MHCSHLSNKLRKQFKEVINTQRRVERINSSSVFMAKRDLETLYDGLFLKTVTLFEAFVEEMFIGLLYNKHQLTTRKIIQKVVFPDRKTTLNYLYYGKRYIDLMPHDKLIEKASVFYNPDNPFSNLNATQKQLLTEIFVIRNAIAHKSDNANLKFKNMLSRKGLSLNHSPSNFLRTLHSPSNNMFNQYIIELAHIANSFTSFT